jgi:DNA-directed RNA polymerase subunit RPC12/RpoP
MATEQIECPECGAEIESMDQLESEELHEIHSTPKGGIGYGEATRNLYLCTNCRKPLGVGRGGAE